MILIPWRSRSKYEALRPQRHGCLMSLCARTDITVPPFLALRLALTVFHVSSFPPLSHACLSANPRHSDSTIADTTVHISPAYQLARSSPAGVRLLIEVQDTGIGIPPERQGQLFQVRERTHGSSYNSA